MHVDQCGPLPRERRSGDWTGSQNPSTAASASDEQFWAKLDDMKQKYRTSLHETAPDMTIISDGQPFEKRKQFMKHMTDVFRGFTVT